MTDTIKASVTLVVSDSFLRDVLDIAAEGGSNDWARFKTIERTADNGRARCVVTEHEASTDAGVKSREIGPVELRQAVVNILEQREDTGLTMPAPRYATALLRAIVCGDAGDLDAIDADCVVQVAVLGELVYG